MGKYGGLSGQYHYKTKAEAEDAMRAARRHIKPITIQTKQGVKKLPDHTMRITGSRGFWTLTIDEKRRKKK